MTDNTAIQETDEMKQQWAKHIKQGASMTDREAMKMALEALERGTTGLAIRAIPALRQALAQPEREWVGLTIEEIKEMLYGLLGDDRTPMLTLVNVVEAKLKEKNA